MTSPFDDLLREIEEKEKAKAPAKRKRVKKRGKSMGTEVVEEISEILEVGQSFMRPLSETERTKLTELIDEALGCQPDAKDALLIHRFLTLIHAVGAFEEANLDPETSLFSLGMAYERLRTKGWQR